MSPSAQPAGLFPVIAALSGNIFITVIKIVGFALTGSSAMFSEAIHTAADTGNQALLMVGIKRSLRKANKNYHYGFGQERFFWALISACGIFFLGAGVTLYHGITSLLHPEPIATSSIGYIVLGIALVIESVTLLLAFKELKSRSGETKFISIIRSGDPTTLAVLYEDAVAVFGSMVAAVSIALTSLTQSAIWDAIGSIIIGLLLVCVAIVLIIKNRGFLIDKAMPRHLEEQVIAILNAERAIEKVIDFKSTVLDINIYRVKCEVEFNGIELLKEINKYGELHEDFENIRSDYGQFVRFCTEMSDRAPRLIGTKINEIEKRIKEQMPHVRHIDIEIN
jgi:solute carrier family 30 (zinc transporter), member 9